MKPKKYNHSKIEKKWQKFWQKNKSFEAENNSEKPKYYSLIEFPYPSGEGLHVGHPRPYIGMDIISRKRRMEGYNVLYPIGWDAFGLPTENYAIKTGKSPEKVTKENTDTFRRQIQSLGISFDWSREINTTDPKYYKWTQWIFLQMFKAGLAYKKKMTINWCPKDKIGLANEEVINGCCERCGTPVEKREKEQWMLAITKYADRLDRDLDTVDYLPQIKLQQRNWIGRSEGVEIKFAVDKHDITVFTTRPDTLFGVTFIAVSPELAKTWLDIGWPAPSEVKNYIEKTLKERLISGFDKEKQEQEKTGISAGFDAINPANKEKVPVWIVNYVIGDVGTGAVMGVPAHDERDFEFAKKYNLPIKQVVMADYFDVDNPPREDKKDTHREVVHVILRNPKNKTVLVEFLKDKKWGDKKPVNFIIGGIEDWGSEMETAINEIREETGYMNVKFVEKLPVESSDTFFAAHKDVNRYVHVHPYVFDLINEEKVDITEDEYFTKDTHEIKWIPYDEVAKVLVFQNNKAQWKYIQEGGFAYEGEGILTNSGEFNGLKTEEAKKKITEFVGGKMVTTYKLRDWIFSRQRYWGEPIPLVFCENCKKQAEVKSQKSKVKSGEEINPGWISVPEKDLPVELPKVKNYQPTDTGESPLASISKWVNVICPQCGGPAKRETDTMPNWAGSSWYYIAYCISENLKSQTPISKQFSSSEIQNKIKYWTPVDWYNGGMEHTTLHLLYSRFWHKFLYDQKLVPTSEPYKKRTSHGLILAQGGEKMSKSKGNVVNPDDIVELYGADSLRLYEMFMGPFDQAIPWSTESIIGVRRFLEKVWKLQGKVLDTQYSTKKENQKLSTENLALNTILHKTIQKVTNDIEEMKFNTAVSAMMILVNEFEKQEEISQTDFEIFLKLLSPFAPHITEEIWNRLGNKNSIALEPWPTADESKMKEEQVTITVQVNGKVRGQLKMPIDAEEPETLTIAKQSGSVSKWLEGQQIKKVIYIKNKLINLVI